MTTLEAGQLHALTPVGWLIFIVIMIMLLALGIVKYRRGKR